MLPLASPPVAWPIRNEGAKIQPFDFRPDENSYSRPSAEKLELASSFSVPFVIVNSSPQFQYDKFTRCCSARAACVSPRIVMIAAINLERHMDLSLEGPGVGRCFLGRNLAV